MWLWQRIFLMTSAFAHSLDYNLIHCIACMAHELAHLKAKHSNEAISAALLWKVPLAVLRLISKVPIFGHYPSKLVIVQKSWAMLKSRTRETEADYLGMRLLCTCGIHPQALIEPTKRLTEDGIRDIAQLKATLPQTNSV